MSYDQAKIDEAVLGLLGVFAQTEHGEYWSWKTFDFEVTGRLFERGLIQDPRGAAKSIRFTPEGIEAARAAAERLFSGCR
ncbi:MAG: DUF6429 family protein [Methyloceanibacter sp.]